MTMPAARKPGRPKDADNAQRRCAEILEAAIRHFAEKGYAEADLEEVAGEVGCAKGTIFRYFPTKRALFEAAVDRVMQEFLAKTEPPAELTGLEHLREALKRTLAFFDAHPAYVEILIQERAVFKDRERPSFFEYLERECEGKDCPVEALMKQGKVREMSPEQVFEVVSRTIYGAIFTNYFMRRKKSHVQQADELIDVLFHGIVKPEAAARETKQDIPSHPPTGTSRARTGSAQAKVSSKGRKLS